MIYWYTHDVFSISVGAVGLWVPAEGFGVGMQGTVLKGLQTAGAEVSERKHTCCVEVEKERYDCLLVWYAGGAMLVDMPSARPEKEYRLYQYLAQAKTDTEKQTGVDAV